MKTTLFDAYRKKYPNYADKTKERFVTATGCDFTWTNMTKSNLYDYVNFLKSVMAKSSARTMCAMLKSVLRTYEDEITLPKNWEDAIYVKKEASQQVFLSDDEIKMVSNYNPTTEKERIVKTMFLLGCLTGARHSDFLKFSKANITQEGFLRYVSIKTHIEAIVPIAPMVNRLIDDLSAIKDTSMADTTFNRILRDICQSVGIDSECTLYRRGEFSTSNKCCFVSSHTARRSFATNLYLRGADLYSISKMMGHSSVDMTAGYICCGLRNLSPEVKDYFEQFC